MSKGLKEIYGAERVLKIKAFLEMIVHTDELSKVNLEYLMDNAEVLLHAIEQAQELEGTVKHAMKAIDNTEAVRVKLINAEQQNKRYREAIEVAIQNIVACKNLGVKFALKILEQVLEGEE